MRTQCPAPQSDLRPGSCSYDETGTIRLLSEEVQIALIRHINPLRGGPLQSLCSIGRDEVGHVQLGVRVGHELCPSSIVQL